MRFLEKARALGRFEIELDRMRSVRRRLGDETGRRIHIPARADRDEQIGCCQQRADASHFVRHLAEPDDVRTHTAGQSTKRTSCVDAKIVPPNRTMRAERAKHFEQLAVHVDQRPRTRRLMQCIDVLGDDRHAAVLSLEAGEREMSGVGFDAAMRAPPGIVEIVDERRIAPEALSRRDILIIVFRPDAVRIAKCRKTAFSRKPGAGENDDVPKTRDCVASGLAADLPAVPQEMVGEHDRHHGLSDRNRANADAWIVSALGDDLGLVSLPVDRPARRQDR